MAWQPTCLPSGLVAETLKALLLQALYDLEQEFSHLVGSKVAVTRSTANEVKVLAAQDLQPGQIAFVPMVSSMAYISQASKKAASTPNAVRMEGYGPPNKDKGIC